MNNELPSRLIQAQPEMAHLAEYAGRLLAWLVADLNESPAGVSPAPAFTASRARALMRAAGTFDEPTWHDFQRLVEHQDAARLALFDLLSSSGLAENEEVQALAQLAAQSSPAEAPAIEWLPLAIAAYAWKREYPLYQLDPASPPGPLSPAGQILTDAAHLIRQQVQRSATDRDKLSRNLAYRAGAANPDTMSADAPIAPLPPHFRPPVPVRYPEFARETVAVQSEEAGDPAPPAPERGEPIVITEADLAGDPAGTGSPQQPVRMPPITISREQIEQTPPAMPGPPSPLPPSAVVMPAPQRGTNPQARSSLTMSLRNMFRQEELKTTKLRVLVQEYPDGPGLYGLQVKVTCRGIKSFVAGTTDREGKFVAELPVRMAEGLTYDVDVDWPREMGAETERKSITLNADRTEFRLPFYRRLAES